MTEPVPNPSGEKYSAGTAAAIAVVLLGALGLFWLVGMGNARQTAEGMEPQIAEHYRPLLGPVDVDCPDGVKTGEDEISDCVLTRTETGQTSPVFVTSLDGDGHYSFQLGSPGSVANP